MKMDWFEGYVGEDEYASGYYENLSPHFLSFAAFCQGFQAPDVSKPFTFIDIASGQGISTVLHASLFPHGQFYGIDLSPSHIAKSRDLAAKVGVDNIIFIEANVKDLQRLDLPDMDFAVAQGVYSWLNRENQQHIVSFLEQKLKARGIFSVHYMLYPGALIGEVIPQLLYTFSQTQQGSNDKRLQLAIDQMEKFLSIGIGFFGSGQNIQKQIARYRGHNLKHLAHDLLSKDRKGHFFSDMATELSRAKLSCIGSSHLYRTFPLTSLFSSTTELLKVFDDGIMHDTLFDFATGDSTRRDMFQRGPKSIPPVLMIEKLRTMSFFRVCEIKNMKQQVKLANLSFNIQKESLDLFTSAMQERYFSGEDILTVYTKRRKTVSIRDVIANIALFVTAGYIKFVPPVADVDAVKERSRKFNREVVHQHLTDNSVLAVSVPRICAGLNINNIERMILSVLVEKPKASAKTIKAKIEKEMKTAGISLTINTPDPEDSDKVISSTLDKEKLDSLIASFLKTRKPFFQDTGVI